MSKVGKKVTPIRKRVLDLFPRTSFANPISFTAYTSPEDAAEILDTLMPEFQRNENVDAIKLLAGEMKAGRFEVTTVMFGVVCGGKENTFINIDGRTRLNAIKKSGIGQWLSYLFSPYESVDRIRKAYGRIDRQRARTFKDWIRANGVLDGVNLHRPIENKIYGIAQTLLLEFKAGRSAYRGEAKVYDLQEAKVAEVLGAIAIYSSILKATRASQRGVFENVSVASVAIYLIHTFGDETVGFISRAVSDDGIKADSYEKILTLKLDAMKSEGNSDVANARRIRAFEYVWNKMCKGKRIKQIRIDDHTSVVSFEAPSI